MRVFRNIPRMVWVLSLVSLFTDMASEMLYPVMPIYLKSIGFSIMLIGVLEGVAEAVAGLSKGYFGRRSDLLNRRLPFVRIGYAMSALSKPLLVISVLPVWVFLLRTLDRLGKGVRTGARDAMLSDMAAPESKGKIFGLHRSMDTMGAVLGPAIALLVLYFFPGNYKLLFLIAFLPGVAAVLSTLYLKEERNENKAVFRRPSFFEFLKYWKQSSKEYRRLLIGLLAFALINSSDVFLLLMARQSGLSDTLVIGAYIFYNLVFAVFAFPLGMLADRIGLRLMLIIGFILFMIVYAGMAFVGSWAGFLVLFFIYGLYAASTEGVSKAWISNVAEKKDTATAIGTYSAFQSLAAMLSSTLAGLIWYGLGADFMFLFTAIGCAGVIFYFSFSIKS